MGHLRLLSLILISTYLVPSPSAAAIASLPLLTRSGERAASTSSTGAATLRLDENAARALSAQDGRTLVQSIPLADGSTEDFEVEPLDVFTKDAVIFETDGSTRRPVALPSLRIFEGVGLADPTKHLIISIVNGTEVWAMVRHAQRVATLIGPSRSREPFVHELIDGASPLADHSERTLCGGTVAAPAAGAAKKAATTGTRAVSDDLLEVELLVDVGNHLYTTSFASNSTTTSTYIGQLMGAVAAVYRRDLRIAPKVHTLVIWTTPETFSAASTSSQLNQYRQYNETNRVGQPRDLAHYIDSRASGGIAYLPGLCGSFGYGVSNIDGDATFPVVGYEWDVNVIAHELGHNLGSNHTHCYSPPIDRCWNQENGCYSGLMVPEVGETMSYCHLVSSISIGFHGFIGNVIRSTVEDGSCIDPKGAVCGDAIVDTTEACDDGNLVDGDCCSSTCQLTGAVNPICDDGQYCTIDYSCPDSSCLSQPRACDDSNVCTLDFCDEEANQCSFVSRDGAACDDGFFCTTTDSCQASACTGLPTCLDDDACTADVCDEGLQTCSHSTKAPSMTCRQAGASSLRIKNSLDDTRDALQWKWSKGATTSHADFLDPDQDTDYSLCIYDENQQLILQADAPAGGTCGSRACWKESPDRGFKYSDRSGAANGTVNLTLKPGVAGSSKISLKGKGVDLSLLPMPLAPTSSLLVQLRNEENSTCYESSFLFPFTKNLSTQLSAKD